MSNIVLFPIVRRTGTITRWARGIARLISQEPSIQNRLNSFANGLRRLGIDEDVVIRETASLETALRREIGRWRRVTPEERAEFQRQRQAAITAVLNGGTA